MTGTPFDRLRARSVDGPIILDGGLATQLEAQGHDLSSALWSARLLTDDPAAIVAAHQAFFEAGAQVAITASYQAPLELVGSSVALAREARDRHGREGRWIAGSVGPYGASLADGSEYHGHYGLSIAELRVWHRPRIDRLAEAGADLLALETVPCLAEVEALLAELAGTGIPAWLSITCVGDRTRAGEPAAEAFAMARGRRRGGRGRRQLHRSPGRGRSRPGRGDRQRQAGRGLPQQRGELGSDRPGLGRRAGLPGR